MCKDYFIDWMGKFSGCQERIKMRLRISKDVDFYSKIAKYGFLELVIGECVVGKKYFSCFSRKSYLSDKEKACIS